MLPNYECRDIKIVVCGGAVSRHTVPLSAGAVLHTIWDIRLILQAHVTSAGDRPCHLSALQTALASSRPAQTLASTNHRRMQNFAF